MSTIAITGQNFSESIKDGIVFVDFWASWCPPCRTFSPIYEAVSDAHPEITWAKIDVDVEQELAGVLDIQSIPTLIIFREGYLIYRHCGVLNQSQLQELLIQVQGVDMEKVKADAIEFEADFDA